MPIKMILIGDSGTGKTGALYSLLEAGYKIHSLDFDNGSDIIENLARGKPFAQNFSKTILTDGFKIAGVNIIPQATAWSAGVKALGEYCAKERTDKDILVLDSLTFAGKSAVRFVLSLNGRIQDLPQFQDYLTAQGMVEKLCAMLYSESVKSHVIVLSHIREISKSHTEMDSKGRPVKIEDPTTRRGFAETGTGQALSPVVGRYFNSVLMADIEGSGPSARRIIRTVPHDNIGLKNSSPGLVRPHYPLATGLADYFTALRG